MKKTIIILLINTLFSSCYIKNFQGSYVYKIPDNSILVNIEPSGRFSYINKQGMMEIISKGKWEIKKRTLHLTSDSNMTASYGKVSEKIISNTSGYSLKFLDYNCDQPEKFIEVIFNGSIEKKPDSLGNILINFPPKTLYVKYSFDHEFFYYISNNNANDFTVCLFLVGNSEKFFDNKKFKISRKSIIFDNKVELKKIE